MQLQINNPQEERSLVDVFLSIVVLAIMLQILRKIWIYLIAGPLMQYFIYSVRYMFQMTF